MLADPLSYADAHQFLIQVPILRGEYHATVDSFTKELLEIIQNTCRVICKRRVDVDYLFPGSGACSYVTHWQHWVGFVIESERLAALAMYENQRPINPWSDSRKFLHVGHKDPGRLTEHHSIFHLGRDEDHRSIRLFLQVIEYVGKNRVDPPLTFLACYQDDAFEADPLPRQNS